MQKKHRDSWLKVDWNGIPPLRRHAYIYAFLVLAAIVGSEFTHAAADASEEAPRNTPSRIENLKSKTSLLNP